MKIDQSILETAAELLKNSHNIVITNHVNPDGDAMGSALGFSEILRQMGHSAQVIVPNEYPKFLKWMKGDENVMIYEGNESVCDKYLMNADLIIHLDYNSLKRSGDMEDILQKAPAQRMIIDHHQQPEDFAHVLYSDTQMSSTCEMVFHLTDQLGFREYITVDAANCLYTGIMTDTGNFRFSSTSPLTHRAVAQLIEAGAKPHEVAAYIYDANSRNRLKLLGRALQSMEVMPEQGLAILSLTAKDLEEFDYQKGDTEGFVNYGLSLEGIVLSVFLSEKDGKIKISFRSKGSIDVNKFAREHFDGGGHINAAGGVSMQSMEQTIVKLKNIISNHGPFINTL